MYIRFIDTRDLGPLEKLLINDQQLIEVLPCHSFANIDNDTMRLFLHKYGVYCLPTKELIDFLKDNIVGSAIEIGSGAGTIARALGIPATDSKLQEEPLIIDYYKSLGQPTIKYPADVEKLHALAAIRKYGPNTVIGSYITHKYTGKDNGSIYGVDEDEILFAKCRYINIGNDEIHHNKPILKYPHVTYRFPWLITRSDPMQNYIRIWK